MADNLISSRSVIGRFYKRLQTGSGMGWAQRIGFLSPSDQESETYGWLGQAPQMRVWKGGRHAKEILESSYVLKNVHYEATIEFKLKDLRRDKSGQVQVRINDLANRTNSHWTSLASAAIAAGETTACYDGQYFFDTDHLEGKSGTQSNDIQVDISTLPSEVAGSITAPSPEQMQLAILKGIAQIMSFKDDQGEPTNEDAESFLVLVPTSLYFTALNALTMPRGTGVGEQLPQGMRVEVAIDPRLTWTDKFAVFRDDGEVKPLILQSEKPVEIKAKAEGSDFEFDNDAHQYGVDTSRAVGYGMWQHACLVTMT